MKKIKNIRVMKTTKLTFGSNRRILAISIMLFAISAISFSQIRNFKEYWLNNLKDKIFLTTEANNHFITVSYHEDAEWMDAPAITRTIIASSAEVLYEENLEVEDWMTSTFESSLENAIEVESWMTTPFETAIEENISVESWMSKPFEYSIESDVVVEDWMTTPFEYTLDESVSVENWMTAPFEIGLEENIALENWMSAPMTWIV